MERWDVAVIGGGILGTSLAYWLAVRYDGRIAVLERESGVGEHTTHRNTGLIHRPFYLDPVKARLFARSAGVSYDLWKAYAAERRLPWNPIGTYKVALDEDQFPVLETYVKWAAANGMEPAEVELLDTPAMNRREPGVSCAGALLCRTDTGADFRAFTQSLRRDAEARGATFLTDSAAKTMRAVTDGVELVRAGSPEPLRARYVVNCAGGDAVDIAHAIGAGREYTDIHFRGEYWIVSDEAQNLAGRNVYTVPTYRDLPFLDPHWIVRANGRREIGPNAVPVPEATAYEGLLGHLPGWGAKLFENPVENKVRLAFNREFLGLSVREMWSSLSQGEMLRRVQRFLPALRREHLVARGFAGIRSTVVDRRGRLLREALEIPGRNSYHILNYNSPGATGAPAFAAYLVDRLAARGDLDHLRRDPKPGAVWDWKTVAEGMELAA